MNNEQKLRDFIATWSAPGSLSFYSARVKFRSDAETILKETETNNEQKHNNPPRSST